MWHFTRLLVIIINYLPVSWSCTWPVLKSSRDSNCRWNLGRVMELALDIKELVKFEVNTWNHLNSMIFKQYFCFSNCIWDHSPQFTTTVSEMCGILQPNSYNSNLYTVLSCLAKEVSWKNLQKSASKPWNTKFFHKPWCFV